MTKERISHIGNVTIETATNEGLLDHNKWLQKRAEDTGMTPEPEPQTTEQTTPNEQ